MDKCDFCNEPSVKWDYPAKTFALFVPKLNVVWGSNEGWAACHICHSLIERGDRHGLTTHAIAKLDVLMGDPEYDKAMTEALHEMHRQFFEHRTGPARPAAVA